MRPSPSPFGGPLPALDTPRLRLRAFVATDAPAVERAVSDAEVARGTLAIPHPYPRGAARTFITGTAAEWAEGHAATWAVVTQDDEALVGAMMLRFTWPHRRAELGYWIARDRKSTRLNSSHT